MTLRSGRELNGSACGEAGKRSIPVTCFTGFLGAGKTTAIFNLIKQLPKDYKVVLVKNEFGDVEVDSLLAAQSNITGVSEILNGCMCCTMVGLVENALMEIKEKFSPDRIIIESSGSAFPATLALQIRQIEPDGFKLDGVITVIDCVNFRGYEDTSPSAKLQARYTDLLLLSKHHLLSEHQMDILQDHLGELNDTTPRLPIGPFPANPPRPEVCFGLDTRLWEKAGVDGDEWAAADGQAANGDKWHGGEVEVRALWRGKRKGKGKEKADEHGHGHEHANGKKCDGCAVGEGDEDDTPIEREVLEEALSKLSFEVYRVKGLVRLAEPTSPNGSIHILNYAFSRFELHPAPELNGAMQGAAIRLTLMGERGEVMRRARRLAEALGGQCA